MVTRLSPNTAHLEILVISLSKTTQNNVRVDTLYNASLSYTRGRIVSCFSCMSLKIPQYDENHLLLFVCVCIGWSFILEMLSLVQNPQS